MHEQELLQSLAYLLLTKANFKVQLTKSVCNFLHWKSRLETCLASEYLKRFFQKKIVLISFNFLFLQSSQCNLIHSYRIVSDLINMAECSNMHGGRIRGDDSFSYRRTLLNFSYLRTFYFLSDEESLPFVKNLVLTSFSYKHEFRVLTESKYWLFFSKDNYFPDLENRIFMEMKR